MIPQNIERRDIIKAIREIDSNGVPSGRRSRKFLLEYNGKHYPPKYIISLANKHANGKELDSSGFGGGVETNNFLRALGFTIVNIPPSKNNVKPLRKQNRKKHLRAQHDERCPDCKQTIKRLLEKVYGRVEQNYKFGVGVKPEDFRDSPNYHKLKKIYRSLQSHRGFSEFVKAKALPSVDFFAPDPGLIVEFDESQHFTQQRKATLESYPTGLKLGFDRERWMALCEETSAKDNDPPYRDEQRAWYDTLRDFLPTIKGLEPTVRLYAEDFEWCRLDPDSPSDVKKFKDILAGPRVDVYEDPDPSLARVVIAGSWEGELKGAKKVLEDICKKWPKGKRVKFLMTCGGFIQFPWPDIKQVDIGDNKNPNKGAVDSLVKKAERYVHSVLGDGLGEKLKEYTDYITLGIDSYKEKVSTTQNYIGQPHIELVFLVNLGNNKLYWTGKSYPTSGQEKGLVRVVNYTTHFSELEGGEVMVLGCHDLTIFNDRNWANTSKWRKQIKKDFRKMAKKKGPIYVLHHPHTTVKTQTWLNPWNSMDKMLQTVKKYAGAGRYYEPDNKPSEWDALDDVLKRTKHGNTIDFIVHR